MLWTWYFYVLLIALFSMVYLFVQTFRNIKIIKNNNLVLYAFLGMFLSMSIWCLGHVLEITFRYFNGYTTMGFVYFYVIGMILVPLFILLLCYSYIAPQSKFQKWWLIFSIPQLVSIFIVITNERYHLFYIKYSYMSFGLVFGRYFLVHNIISYTYIGISVILLFVYQKKFSKLNAIQIQLIIIGILLPFSINVLVTYNIIKIPTCSSAVSSVITALFWYWGIIRYGLLNSGQLAIKHIIDGLDSSFLVVNQNLLITDYNRPFEKMIALDLKKFTDMVTLTNQIKNESIKSLLKSFAQDISEIRTYQNKSVCIVQKKTTKHFDVDSTYLNDQCCFIFSLKDATLRHWKLIETLIRTVDARNKYTCGHSVRVAYYAVKIGKKMGLPYMQLLSLWQSGLAHDIGKIGIPDSILNSDLKLTDEQFEQIKLHPQIGAGIVGGLEELSELKTVILYHHERIDGNGYYNLVGDEIPLMSKILAVSDTYDAMSSGRPYQAKPLIETYEILNILEGCNCIDTQLDKTCFLAFVEVMITEGYLEKNRGEDGKIKGTGKIHDFVYQCEDGSLKLRNDYVVDLTINPDELGKILTECGVANFYGED